MGLSDNEMPPVGMGVTEWRLNNHETRLGSLENDRDKLPEIYVRQEQHNDLRRIVYGIIGLAFSTVSIIFASSAHLWFK